MLKNIETQRAKFTTIKITIQDHAKTTACAPLHKGKSLGSTIISTNVRPIAKRVHKIVNFKSPSICLNVIVFLIASKNLLLLVAMNTKKVARKPAKSESKPNTPE